MNANFLYQFTVLVFSMIGLSTTIMMIAEAFSLGVGASLPKWATYLIVLLPVILFTVACYISGDGELQLMMATWFSLGLFSFNKRVFRKDSFHPAMVGGNYNENFSKHSVL